MREEAMCPNQKAIRLHNTAGGKATLKYAHLLTIFLYSSQVFVEILQICDFKVFKFIHVMSSQTSKILLWDIHLERKKPRKNLGV